MNLFLPTLNATLNALSFACLVLGYWQIRRGQKEAHKITMILALVFSTAFLASYLYYHATVGSVPYPFYDWTRPLYFLILIPHVILATLMVPFIMAIVIYAAQKKWEAHKKWAKLVWPVWVYVSFTGVLVYLFLYRPF